MGFLSNLLGNKASHTAAASADVALSTNACEQPASQHVAVAALCPVAGVAMDITDVVDQVFASKAMGDGIAIKPTSDELVAPFSGTIEALFPTGHALAIKHESGVGVMLHIGIDTVEMKGDGFIAHVAQGDHVVQGQVLVTFNRDKIAAAGFDDTTMVIAAEVPAGLSMTKYELGPVVSGQPVLSFA